MNLLFFHLNKEEKKNYLEAINKVEETSYDEILPLKDLAYELNENPVSEFIIAIDNINKEVVAYLDFWLTFDSSTIFKIVVKKEYRNQGIANRLLEKMFSYLKEKEVLYSTLEVRKDNAAALSLYLKLGYEKITTKEKYYKDGMDAYYMVKGI